MHKKILCQLCIVGICIIALKSCSINTDEVPTLIVGEDFTNTDIRVLYLDTFDIKFSTMKFDSIITSGTPRLLFGQYNDFDFGTVTSSSYFELTSTDYSIDDDAVLDSVGLVLNYDNYFYKDTLQNLNLDVYRLTERFRPEDGTDFYNTSVIASEDQPLASISFSPKPNRDSLYVPFPIEFGTDLFQKILDNDINDNESLLQELRGVAIKPGENDNGAIVGFATDRSYIKFYYTIPDEFEDEERELTLLINTANDISRFNNIKSNVEDLPLQVITDQEEELLSTQSNNFGYLQAGIGYTTKIEFPSLKTINELQGTGTVINAILSIKPNRNSYSDTEPINDILELFIVNQNNDITEQIFNNLDAVTARLVRENSEFGEIVYSVPVLEFIDRKLTEQPETEDALILISPEYNSTVNSLLLNDFYNEDFEAKLEIVYALIDDE